MRIKNKKGSKLDKALQTSRPYLNEFLSGIWAAVGSVRRVTESDLDRETELDMLPRSHLDQRCSYWCDIDRTIKQGPSLDDFSEDDMWTRRSAVFAGPAGVGKTTIIHALSRHHTVSAGGDMYVVMPELDTAGALTAKGLLAKAKVYAADDFDLVSQNGVPLSETNVKQLFEVPTASGYECRYRNSAFEPKVMKLFGINYDAARTEAGTLDRHLDTNSVIHRCPWIHWIVQGKIGLLNAASVNIQAQARRIVVWHITESIASKELASRWSANTVVDMEKHISNSRRIKRERRERAA
jgi:hypothetical protein